ncbi:MAG: hypothetical protein RR048_07590, partial [Oscillospiraceae bacterium]
ERKEFIIFADGDDEDFVNDKFTLKCSTTRYRTQHEIRWEREVVDESGNPIGDPTEDQLGAVVLPKISDQTSKDLTVDIKPRVEDTLIKLKATITLKVGGKEYTNASQNAEFILNIRGTGELPSTWNIKNFYVVKENDKGNLVVETNWGTNEEAVDQNFFKKLDIYTGLNKKFPLSNDAPHQMGLLLKMGKRNASSVHIKIQSSNPDIVEAEVYRDKKPGQSDLYKYGSAIENPSTNLYEEGEVVVGFVPKKTGTTTITVEYYKKGKFANDVRLTKKEEFPIQVVDNSPSSDATLSKLQVMNEEKKEIDIGFLPTTTEYEKRVPHAISKVSFVATKNHRLAKKEIKFAYEVSEEVTEGIKRVNYACEKDIISG